MTEKFSSQADFLDYLANMVARHEEQLGAVKTASMQPLVAPLTAGLATSSAIPDVRERAAAAASTKATLNPLPSVVGSSVASATLGNTQPFVGQTNLIWDPELTSIWLWNNSTDLTKSWQNIGNEGWLARIGYDSTEGAWGEIARTMLVRGDPDNPFNSSAVEIVFGRYAASGNGMWLEVDSPTFRPENAPPLPYFVGALRLATLYNGSGWSGWSSATGYLQLWDWTSGVARAQSQAYDLLAMLPGTDDNQVQLMVGYGPGTTLIKTHDHSLRLRLEGVLSSPSATEMDFYFGEPQVSFSPTADALAYQPLVGTWVPDRLRAYAPSANAIIKSYIKGGSPSASPAWQVSAEGKHYWRKPDVSTSALVRLARSGHRRLAIDGGSDTTPGSLEVGGDVVPKLGASWSLSYNGDGTVASITRSGDSGAAEAAVSYSGGKVSSVVSKRGGKIVTVTPTYTGDQITSLSRTTADWELEVTLGQIDSGRAIYAPTLTKV